MGKRFALALASTVLTLALVECGFRSLATPLGVDRDALGRLRDYVTSRGAVAQFVPRPYVVYVRNPALPDVNERGFPGPDVPAERRPGVPRVACLGSSTTESGNAQGWAGSYPRFLQDDLAARLGGEVEVLNFGISSWTSAEVMVNYFVTVQDFAPDVVLIHEVVNDAGPRSWPGYRTDYSHYRKQWSPTAFALPIRLAVATSDVAADLLLRRARWWGVHTAAVVDPEGHWEFANGHFPPGTDAAYRRNIRTIAENVRLHGGRPVLVTMPYDPEIAQKWPTQHAALDEHNQILREMGASEGWLVIDLDAASRAEPTPLAGRFIDIVHLDSDGNRWKAHRIADAIGPLLASGAAP